MEQTTHTVPDPPELDDLADTVPDCTVVVDHDALHSLDETPLDVARLGSLDGCINETLAASHGVEVELRGREAGQVRVLNEAA